MVGEMPQTSLFGKCLIMESSGPRHEESPQVNIRPHGIFSCAVNFIEKPYIANLSAYGRLQIGRYTLHRIPIAQDFSPTLNSGTCFNRSPRL